MEILIISVLFVICIIVLEIIHFKERKMYLNAILSNDVKEFEVLQKADKPVKAEPKEKKEPINYV